MKPPVFNPEEPQDPVKTSHLESSEIGDGRAAMGSPHGRQAQDAVCPGGVGQKLPRIKAPHAVPNQVDRLAWKGRLNLLAEHDRSLFDSRDCGNTGHDHPIPGSPKLLGYPSKVGGKRDPSDSDPAITEEAVRKHNRRIKTGANNESQSLLPAKMSTVRQRPQSLPCSMTQQSFIRTKSQEIQ